MSGQPWGDDQRSAVDLAQALFANPEWHADLLRGKGVLPSTCIDVIKLALDSARHADDAPPDKRHRAALFFVEHVLLSEQSDHYRVLGLTSSASADEIREHYRLMMAVFHPDRSAWAGCDREDLAARINLAYQVLRHPGRRAEYNLDLIRHERERVAPVVITPAPSQHAHAATRPRSSHREVPPLPVLARLPVFVQRHLPQFVLGSVALIGFSLVLGALVSRPTSSGAIGAHGSADKSQPAVQVAGSRSVSPVAKVVVAPEGTADTVAPLPAGTDLRAPPVLKIPVAGSQTMTFARVPVPAPAENGASARTQSEPEPTVATPPKAADAVREQDMTQSAADHEPDWTRARALEAVDSAAPESGHAADARASSPSPSISPLPDLADVPVPAATGKPALEDAYQVLNRFRGAYRSGDIASFMSLFDPAARSNSGGLDTIRADYDGLFKSTVSRDFGFHELRWSANGDEAVAEGGFIVTVQPVGTKHESVHAGTARIVFVKVENRVLISGLFHQLAK